MNKYLTKIAELKRKGKIKPKARPRAKAGSGTMPSLKKPGQQAQTASPGFFIAKGSVKAQAMTRMNRPTHQMAWAGMSDDTRKKK